MKDCELTDLDLEAVAGGKDRRPVVVVQPAPAPRPALVAPSRGMAPMQKGGGMGGYGGAGMSRGGMGMGGYGGGMMAAPRAGGCASGNCG